MISRVDHVAIAVKVYDKALSFFAEVLGAIPGSSAKDPGKPGRDILYKP